MHWFRTYKEARRFQMLPAEKRKLVFYSEDNGSWVHFEKIVTSLTQDHGVDLCYLTSSPNDPILSTTNKHILPFYIGTGMVRTALFTMLDADVVVMTMPDLGTYQIKRSSIRSIHYVYVFHSLVSTHMTYRRGAFDQYDSVLCVGPHHVNEIRAWEEILNLRKKDLYEVGYARLDSILEKKKGPPDSSRISLPTKRILVAPTHGERALFETCGADVIRVLLKGGFQVVARPHPVTVRKSHALMLSLQGEFGVHPNFVFETDIGSQTSLHDCDVMISDWSGAALEYAFGLERPVVFIDIEKKINNPDYNKIPCSPVEVSLREQLGRVVNMASLPELPRIIEELCASATTSTRHAALAELRQKSVFNVGNSGKAGAESLIKILSQSSVRT